MPLFLRERLAACALWYDEMWRSTKEIAGPKIPTPLAEV
jgi:hypothetical protein